MATDEVRFPHVLFLPAVKTPEDVWQPRADVHRIPGGWLVKLELAGVDPDEIRLATRGSMLWIEGTRRDARVQECLGCHHMEIAYSRFERTLELPGLSESAELGVSYRDGMLLIRIQTESNR
jgi:HSP20 family molecular chaperone IbpA